MDKVLESEVASPMRSRIVAGALCACFGVVGVKGGMLAAFGDQGDPLRAEQTSEETRQPFRADILDRNGARLATSVQVISLAADPSAIWDGADHARQLSTVLTDLNVEFMAERLSDSDRKFVWIDRDLSPEDRQAVFNLGLEGLQFVEESRRFYPKRTLAGHVVGFTSIDGEGLAGIEFHQDHRLEGRNEPIRLTIDSSIQYSLEAELDAAAVRHNAIGGAGIVLEASSGEVLGMASWPAIDPNEVSKTTSNERLNRASTAVYELGSVFKPLTVAAGIDLGHLTLNETFDVRGSMQVGTFKIQDDHPVPGGHRASLTAIMAHSSNIGTARIGLRLSPDEHSRFLADLGLEDRSPVELGGSGRPLLPERWGDVTQATVSYGHGIAVSPVAFASAFAALANEGDYLAPTLLLNEDPLGPVREPRRVMSSPTAQVVTQMMRAAVTDGTGRTADIPGYRVAGKTGTAEKPIAGGYADDRNVTSFAAMFPANDPQYVVLIVLDEPKAPDGRALSAAFTAAPAAGRVIERIAPILDVMPYFEDLDPVGPEVRAVSDRRSL